MSREDHIASTAHDIYTKIPLANLEAGSFDMLQTRQILLDRNQSVDTVTPCQVVLLQEAERWNNLVKKMAVSLLDLQRALVGEIGACSLLSTITTI
jgi:dynein heavy chain